MGGGSQELQFILQHQNILFYTCSSCFNITYLPSSIIYSSIKYNLLSILLNADILQFVIQGGILTDKYYQ